MCNWIIDQINNINIPTVMASMASSWIVKEVVDWRKQRNLQGQQASFQKMLQQEKAKFDLELEATKTHYQREIQSHYLQTQLKTTSIYKVYPEVFSAFKETEGLVHQSLYYSEQYQKETYQSWCKLTQKVAEHSLFLDDNIQAKCSDAIDALATGMRSHSASSKEVKDACMEDIHQKINSLRNLMRPHLLGNK